MNHEERKRYVSFCGSYCRTCDWFSGKIRHTFQSASCMLEEYGIRKLLEGNVDIENFKEGLRILANTLIDSGCKAEITKPLKKAGAGFANVVVEKVWICAVSALSFLAICWKAIRAL